MLEEPRLVVMVFNRLESFYNHFDNECVWIGRIRNSEISFQRDSRAAITYVESAYDQNVELVAKSVEMVFERCDSLPKRNSHRVKLNKVIYLIFNFVC